MRDEPRDLVAADKYGDEISADRERPPGIDASHDARFAQPVVD
jgi:hypothetical protein